MSTKLLAQRDGRSLSLLDNGIRVATWQDHRYGPNVSLSINFDSGALDDPTEQAGLTHLTEHVVVSSELNRFIKRRGSDVNAYTRPNRTEFVVGMPVRDLGNVFSRLAGELRNPTISPTKLKIERHRIYEEIATRSQLTQVARLYNKIAGLSAGYDPTPGSKTSLNSINIADIQQHWVRMLNPHLMSVAFAGATTHSENVALVDASFGNLRGSPRPLETGDFSPQFIPAIDIQSGGSRCNLVVCYKSLDDDHPLASHAPGLGYFMGTHPDHSIAAHLSDTLGLTYTQTGGTQNLDGFLAATYTCSFNPSKALQVAQAINTMTHKLPLTLTDENMAERQRHIQYRFETRPLSLDDMRDMLIETASSNKLPDSPQETLAQLAACSTHTMRRIARLTFTGQPALSIAGPGSHDIIRVLRPDSYRL